MSLRTALRAGDLDQLRITDAAPTPHERRYLTHLHTLTSTDRQRLGLHWSVKERGCVVPGDGTEGKLVGLKLDGTAVIAWDPEQFGALCRWLDAVNLERQGRASRVYGVLLSVGYDLRAIPLTLFGLLLLAVVTWATLRLATLFFPFWAMAWMPGIPMLALGWVMGVSLLGPLPELVRAVPALLDAVGTPAGMRREPPSAVVV